jgi:hypothetical protein
MGPYTGWPEKYGVLLERVAGMAPGPVPELSIVLCGMVVGIWTIGVVGTAVD